MATKKQKKHAPRVVAKKAKITPAKTVVLAPKNTTGVVPLADRVLVRPLSAEEAGKASAFGIILPDSDKQKSEQGVVVAVGPGRRGEDGRLQTLSVSVGDKVLFSKYGYDEVKVNGKEYLILPESSVLAIIE